MNGRIQRLRAEIASDRRAIAAHFGELVGLDLSGPTASSGDVARAAIALHHLYSAIETVMVRVARETDGGEPSGGDWHQALLDSMALHVDGVRSAVISEAIMPDLHAMLGFRHFFRHAYSVALDPVQLAEIRELACRVRPALEADLDRLDASLAQAATTTEGSETV